MPRRGPDRPPRALTARVTPWETRAIERAQAEQAEASAAPPAQTASPPHAVPAAALAAALADGQAVDRARLTALGPGGIRALQGAIGNRALARLVAGIGPAAPGRPPTPTPRTRQAPPVPAVQLARVESAARPAVVARRPSSARGRLLQRYSRAAAAAYARTWAMRDNPAYGRIEPNDCTNFVSQALIAGGWTMSGGSCSDRKDKNAWWFNPMECRWVGGRPWATEVKASFTWGGAQNLYWFMKASGRGAEVPDPMDLEIGDVLQMDMGSGHYNAGHIGHSMIVTGKSAADLLLSYHEDHHLDEPLSAIKSRYPSATWYPWMPGGRAGDYPLPSGDDREA